MKLFFKMLLKIKKKILFLLPFILLIVGLYSFPLRIFNNDFSKIPGDLGDARFNNYILEHGHKFLTGKIDKYWDAPFMYPYKNVIAFSDNLLGTLPIYSLFRLAGTDRETSFQFWMLALFTLNFLFSFWIINKWSGNIFLASFGAYVYAFSIYNLGQLNHVQVLPRFIVPVVFFWSWKYLSEKHLKYFLLTILGIVYQFFCGIYIGFLLLYVLLFLFVAYLIIFRQSGIISQFKNRRILLTHLGITILGGLLLYPLMIPYLEVANIMGTRNFEQVAASLPRLQSYFFASPAPVLWNFLYHHSAYSFPGWWNHYLFPGLLPWLGILIAPFLLLSRRTENKKLIGVLLLGFLLSIIFCLNVHGFTLYKAIYSLPGFSSMRSLDRVINTQIMYFILISVFVFKELALSSKIMKWAVMLLPVLVVADNLFIPWPWAVKCHEKKISQDAINEVKETIKKQYDSTYIAIAFIPIRTANEPGTSYGEIVALHLNVMIASQELNISCVNAYTGFEPGSLLDFFYNANDSTLKNWCNFNEADCDKIQRIYETGTKEISKRVINLKAYNGKFLCADESKNNIVIADKEAAQQWETFSLVNLGNSTYALLAHTGSFFCAELNSQGEITATREKTGEWETFTLILLDSNKIALKAINNKYVSLNEKSLQLFAIADSIGEKEKFQLIPGCYGCTISREYTY